MDRILFVSGVGAGQWPKHQPLRRRLQQLKPWKNPRKEGHLEDGGGQA